MKRVLVLAIGCDLEPWKNMANTSMSTWDSISVEGVETIFYFGNPVKENTEKCIYFPVVEEYATMGHKMLLAFDWVLKNKKFDFIARINSSCYCDKEQLIKYVQDLPTENLFEGGVVKSERDWCWGGLQYIISKDVIEKIVANKDLWHHELMEDVSLSYIAADIGIEFKNGKGCSIDKDGNGWRCISYGGESISFTNFTDLKKLCHHFYRVKQDNDREQDAYLMNELFKALNSN